MRIPSLDITYPKMAIVIGEDDTLCCFCLINSKRRTNLAKREFQVELLLENNSFLDYNSFVDCAEVHLIPKASVNETWKNGKIKILGNLNNNDIEEVLNKGRSERNIILTPKKKSFFQ